MKILIDRNRYVKSGFLPVTIMFLKNPCFRYVLFLRLCQSTSLFNPIGLLGRLMLNLHKGYYGIQIPHKVKIGPGFFISHYGGIVVTYAAKIGSNVNLGQGVTIGRINAGTKKGAPTLGNNVWIGANSVLVGNITIGSNVLIAPLSYVNFDVPDNSLVMGNPAKIVEGKGSEDYINFF